MANPIPQTVEATLDMLAQGNYVADRSLARVTVRKPEDATALLAIDAAFEVELLLSRFSGDWLLSLSAWPARLVVRQPTYERLTEAADHDLDLPSFFRALRTKHASIPARGVPACILGEEPLGDPRTLDTTMMTSEETMDLLSSVRLGINLNLLDDVSIATVNELFLHTQPAHLQKLMGASLDGEERNSARARYLRTRLRETGPQLN